MSNYVTPNVYVREIDRSLYTRGESTSVAGFIGTATTGPVGKSILITSLAAFEEVFGNARLDSYLYHGVKDFFEQGGSVCYVVRTAHYTNVSTASTLTAAKPTATITSGGSTPEEAIIFKLTPGTFYNNHQIEISTNDDDTFNVFLKDASGNLIEGHSNLVSGLRNIGNTRHVEAYFPRSSLRGIEAEDLGVAPVSGTATFSGGTEGLNGLTDNDFIGASTSKTGLHAFDDIDSVRILAGPGVSSPAFIQGLITYCELRQNIVPIVGTPSGLNPQAALEFRMGRGTFTHSAFNSNFAALYWPWILRLDPATKQQRYIPVEGTVAGLYAYNDFIGYPWTAPAGPNRGIVRNSLGVEYAADNGENGELYAKQVNVIRNFSDIGVVVWGQKTLTSKSTAFDRMNVRRLFIYLEDQLKVTSKYLLFEPNSPDTWDAFIRYARPLLEDVRSKGGIAPYTDDAGYKVICDETTNTPFYRERNVMRAVIFVRPTKTAEFIELVFTATPQEAGFENLGNL